MVWKKPDSDPPAPEPVSAPPRASYATPNPPPATTAPPAPPAPAARGERATIGPSIFIKGDLAGEEDLIIEGRVEGRVDLRQHNLTVGKNGRVKADLVGRVVTVEGEVDGNVFAEEQAVVRTSGTVHGNITSPRVTLEDGSKFKGSIDMEAKAPPRTVQAAAGDRPRRDESAAREAPRDAAPGTGPTRAPETATATAGAGAASAGAAAARTTA
ncbi:MAG TPA: polymer-forming cytoskeletal protein [Thermoanaerobaculia bacterium]|nr:polymer-forming cytoskeletal protein [Thermoanaerobaculia bacterium]